MIVKRYDKNVRTIIIYKDKQKRYPIGAEIIYLVHEGKRHIYYEMADCMSSGDITVFEDVKKRIKKDKILMFNGVREDIIEKVRQYLVKVAEYNKLKSRAIDVLKARARDFFEQELEKWEKENPFPVFE
uniref:Uncharacterized protein n=1 Tax=Geoglobus ahangari TaxID=113653 RepID=A0A7J3TIY7_9EURY